jgi:hypothetical protein
MQNLINLLLINDIEEELKTFVLEYRQYHSFSQKKVKPNEGSTS